MIRRQSLETKINHERWLVSYSDFITLLFAFFVVMYSVSHVNEEKYRQLSTTLESAFSAGGQSSESQQENTSESTPQLAEVQELAQEIQSELSSVLDDDAISISGNEQWLEIELSAGLLFPSAGAELSDAAKKILTPVSEILAPYENAVAIAGHTDDKPISNETFASNWALSSARAVSVVNFLAYQGVKPERLSAVGYGEYRPVVANSNDESRARNRRVVIRIAQDAAPASLVAADAFEGDEAADTPETSAETQSDETVAEQAVSEGQELPNAQSRPADEKVLTTVPASSVQPVRLQGGGLLFTSDPDLPRTNPPVGPANRPVVAPEASPNPNTSP